MSGPRTTPDAREEATSSSKTIEARNGPGHGTGSGGEPGGKAGPIPGRWRFPLALISTVALGLLLGAGGYWALNLRDSAPPEPPPASQSAEAASPLVRSSVVCPLCGASLERMPATRPLAVMIDNLPAARPPSGLEEADLVYEAPAEGGVTRLMPVFYHQKPGKIGPVRSVRPYYITLAQEHQAIIVHCGGSQEALEQIKSQNIASIDELLGIRYFWRSTQRSEPHNLYSSSEMLEQAAKELKLQKGVKLPARVFMNPDTSPAGGIPAASLSLDYGSSSSEVRYVYDPSQRMYLRFNGGSPHRDADSGRQLAAANVVVQYVSGRVLDAEGRLQLGVLGTGKAEIHTRGQKIEATWAKSSPAARTVFKDRQGQEVAFAPGTTWVQLVTPQVRVY